MVHKHPTKFLVIINVYFTWINFSGFFKEKHNTSETQNNDECNFKNRQSVESVHVVKMAAKNKYFHIKQTIKVSYKSKNRKNFLKNISYPMQLQSKTKAYI